MDTGRSSVFAGGLRVSTEPAIDRSGFFGTRRGLGNIRWYEYTFLAVGLLAALVTDGLTIARLVRLGSLAEPEFAYGVLIIIHSIFLLGFLTTGILYQRTTDVVAFFLSSILLTIYVIAHFIAARNVPDNGRNTQPEIRLARLIFTIIFNVCFFPLAYKVIKAYDRDEFSKRLFGAFPAARRPFKIYSIFDCIVRLTIMLSISSLILNMYNATNTDVLDSLFLVFGIPIAFAWLTAGIGMARWEKKSLFFAFCFFSLVQLIFLIVILYYAVTHQIDISKDTTSTTTPIVPTTTTITVSTTTTTGSAASTTTATTGSTTLAPITNTVPVLVVLYVCIAANFVLHVLSIIFGSICLKNFGQGLKEKIFNNKIDKWVQQRWSGQ